VGQAHLSLRRVVNEAGMRRTIDAPTMAAFFWAEVGLHLAGMKTGGW
jgi:hypothetical protein